MDVIQDSIEIWKPVPGWEGYYEASALGRIKGINCDHTRKQPRIHNPHILSTGYLSVAFRKAGAKPKRLFVHVVVAATFIGPKPDGMQVNHIDAVKSNNRLENLEYVTPRENKLHAYQMGCIKILKGEAHGNAKITNELVKFIRESPLRNFEIARLLNIGQAAVHNVRTRKSWAHIE